MYVNQSLSIISHNSWVTYSVRVNPAPTTSNNQLRFFQFTRFIKFKVLVERCATTINYLFSGYDLASKHYFIDGPSPSSQWSWTSSSLSSCSRFITRSILIRWVLILKRIWIAKIVIQTQLQWNTTAVGIRWIIHLAPMMFHLVYRKIF